MMFGLLCDEYDFTLRTVVNPLKACGAEVWCFGSRARGDHRRFSDLDVMVESARDLTKDIGDIQEKLIDSRFPYKVDIVQYKDFAESYRQNFLRDRVRFGNL